MLAGAILMLLVGVIRGLGAVMLLTGSPTILADIQANGTTVQALAIILFGISLGEVVAAVGVFLLKRSFWTLGLIVTVLFVIDGLLNGIVFYGRPGVGGTVVNLVFAVLIVFCLVRSRPVIDRKEKGDGFGVS